jgi:16S rRNA (uracil1498-N3)-methyltransferase
MLQRLYVPQFLTVDGVLSLKDEQAHYILHVLRLNIGDQIRFFDGLSGEFLAQIVSNTKKEVCFQILLKLRDYKVLKKLKLVFAPLKQDRLNVMIEKATELGATCFQPISTEYTQVRKVNKERLQKIAIEACEQSERQDVPIFYDLINLDQYLYHTDDHVIFCCERLTQNHEINLMKYDTVIIGPEGGFSSREKGLLGGKIPVMTLGETILRAETAAIVALDRLRFLG